MCSKSLKGGHNCNADGIWGGYTYPQVSSGCCMQVKWKKKHGKQDEGKLREAFGDFYVNKSTHLMLHDARAIW